MAIIQVHRKFVFLNIQLSVEVTKKASQTVLNQYTVSKFHEI